MNIKNIKAIKEKKALWRDFGGDFLVEDMAEEDRGRCMPYYTYPIPKIDDLIESILPHSKLLEIKAEQTELGFNMYHVTIEMTIQDTVTKTFSQPFLDDALAEALLALCDSVAERAKMTS